MQENRHFKIAQKCKSSVFIKYYLCKKSSAFNIFATWAIKRLLKTLHLIIQLLLNSALLNKGSIALNHKSNLYLVVIKALLYKTLLFRVIISPGYLGLYNLYITWYSMVHHISPGYLSTTWDYTFCILYDIIYIYTGDCTSCTLHDICRVHHKPRVP